MKVSRIDRLKVLLSNALFCAASNQIGITSIIGEKTIDAGESLGDVIDLGIVERYANCEKRIL